MLVWERETGRPLGRAIVWQDRRTSALCAELRAAGHEAMVTAQTGLLLDPYFSGTKLKWLLDAHEGARERRRRGELLFGTVDSCLIWKLTGGRAHVTDATNAARTLLYNIHLGAWDAGDLRPARRPARDAARGARLRRRLRRHPGRSSSARQIPILGVAGDQQAATVGQACFAPGMLKATYGTGCFAVLNTGDAPVASRNRLLTTLAYQLDGKPTYALEGSIFIAGAVVQWLRDGLKIIRSAAETQAAGRGGRPGAAALPGAGLHRARRALLGPRLPRRDLRAHPQLRPGRVRPRGARERRLPDPRPRRGDARRLAGRRGDTVLRVDGGMTANDWVLQGSPTSSARRSTDRGSWRPRRSARRGLRACARGCIRVRPNSRAPGRSTAASSRRWTRELREERYAGWRDAVRRTLSDRA